ncbi:MAG: VWA domain-containing protein [Bryobacterales bacterium]|nr:VWA domain-containing protein [Bryobacterales bacterium]
MFFFNLTAAEFLALFGAVSSLVVVLYLLDRSRKKITVATLRFWQASEIPSQRKHRRKIQQPLSLLLQLLAVLLLLLAIAQLRIGSPDRSSRDHVLLLDASAWMGAQGAGRRTLLDEARVAAIRYLRALPSSDRVMLVRADALATPLTGFETNRATLEDAIRRIQPGSAALSLGQGIEFAAQALRLEGKRAGEIVFAGSGRMMSESIAEMPGLPRNLRLLPIKREVENCGLRKLSMRRSAQDPELWQIYVTARNYGQRPRTVPLTVAYGGAPVGTRRLTLAPGAEVSSSFEFRTKSAGWLEAQLESNDALSADDSATLELPGEASLRVVVYTNQPELLRPLLSANPHVETVFRPATVYEPDPKAGLLIFDRFRPTAAVNQNAIWIEPPASGSPVPLRAEKKDVTVHWRTDQFLAAGLRTKDIKLEQTALFSPASSDMTIAEADGGAAILARPGAVKTALFGFHPMRSAMRYELATPLLFANVLKWMAPDIFTRVELQAGSTGTVSLPLDADYDPSRVRVLAGERTNLPFTIRNRTLRFFSGTPETVRVSLGDRDVVYSMTVPEVGETRWEPPKSIPTGLAGVGGVESAARDVWQWLAILAALVLIAEWILFGMGAASSTATHRVFPFLKKAETPRRKAS